MKRMPARCFGAVLFLWFLTSASGVLRAAPLLFSGSLSGFATESATGRCAPLITVNAVGSGTSNLLGNFFDTQSNCTTSLTSFGDGLFILTSIEQPANSIQGTYSGTVVVEPSQTLEITATLDVTGGSGQFAGATGTLESIGSLFPTGAYTATFSGTVNAAPEPSALLLLACGLVLCALAGGFLDTLRKHTVISRGDPFLHIASGGVSTAREI